jgi:hypothetical protein
MIKRTLLFSGLIFVLFFSACTKTEEVVVPNNTAPPDPTISGVIVQNYVNRLYISLIGRKPLANELQAGINMLTGNHLSLSDRRLLIDTIIKKPEYNSQLFSLANIQLLNNLDTSQVTQFIGIFNGLLANPDYAYAHDVLRFEIGRMELAREIPRDLDAGTLTVIGMHRRLVNNYFYDQVNMGTENFVLSMFMNFLYRQPTVSELDEAKKVVDGFSGIVFSEVGKSKDEFLDIFFRSPDYFEGQVRNLYVRYLFREPTSEEMASYAIQYKSSTDYVELQKKILSSDEYIGL